MPINLKGNEITSGDTTNAGVFKTRIPTDGLVFFLDAADKNSYSGTGTSWTDLSGNGNNFTWASTPTFTDSGLGSYFSTNNNLATGPASNSVGINNTSGYSVIWISLTNNQGSNSGFKFAGSDAYTRGIFVHPSWTNSTIYFDQGGCCGSDTRTSYTFTTGDFSAYRMWTLTSDVYTRQIWMNDVAYTTNTTTAADINLTATGIQVAGTNEGYWDARLKVFLVYRRRLERNEISQIYQALKGRL